MPHHLILNNMETRTIFILRAMNVAFWVILIGLCIKAGALIIAFAVSLAVNPAGASDLYMGLDYSALYKHSLLHYICMVTWVIALACTKVALAWRAVDLSLIFKVENPFNKRHVKLLSQMSDTALSAALISLGGEGYSRWLMHRGVELPPSDWAAGEWLFWAGIIYLLSVVFEKGVELKSENELTI